MTFKQSLMRHVYSWVLRILSPFYLIKLWYRGRKEPEYGQQIEERFGFYIRHLQPLGYRKYIWVHAVSLGEARAAAVLIEALRQEIPDMQLLLTHGTATGRIQGKALLQKGDVQLWLPIDMPGAAKRFFQHFRPRIGLLMETEMWPNLLYMSKQMDVPVMLVNARLSERSLRGALKAESILRSAYTALTAALAQSEEDAERLKVIGAPVVEVLGNIKYDMHPDSTQLQQGRVWRARTTRIVVMAASTREGEEEELLQAWQQAPWSHLPVAEQPLLLLVPRHPQRFEQVEELLKNKTLAYSARSQWDGNGPNESALQAQVWLGNSIREMPMYYGLADMVLMGGSFKPFGGQNFIEALACGCPIILGQHTYNFTLASQLAIDSKVAFRVDDFEESLKLVDRWVQAPDQLSELKSNSELFIKQHQGASKKMAIYIAEKLSK